MSVFKNVIVYRIEASWSPSLTGAEEALAEHRFVPCGPSQEKSAGWTEPRGQDHGPLVESVGGQWLLEFMIEAKTLPGSVVRRKVDERCAQIEATTGRKPGKKEKRDLKEDITHELLPMAFTRHARIAVWIDPNERRLVINASNAGIGYGILVGGPSFILMIGISALELLVCAIQAYVFALLTSLYLNDAVNLH